MFALVGNRQLLAGDEKLRGILSEAESGGLSRSSSKLNAGSSSKPEVTVRLFEPWLIWLHIDVNVSYVDFEGLGYK